MPPKAELKKQSLPIGREHIECDAPGCSRPGPSKRCSRCQRAFYCSVQCQRAHWKSGHRKECSDINFVRQQCLKIGKTDENETKTTKAETPFKDKPPINTSCFICLSEPMIDPFVLPRCGHGFCFSCLQNWQGFTHSKIDFYHDRKPEEQQQPKCPACRAEAPDIARSVHETAILYAARAHNRDLSEDQQQKYLELALEELDKLDPSAAMDPRQKLQTLFTRAEVLQQLERPEEAYEALVEAEGLHEEGTQNLDKMNALLEDFQAAQDEGRFADAEAMHARMEEYRENNTNIASFAGPDAFDLCLNMAQCKQEMGDYKGAKVIYKSKFMAIMDFTPPQQRKMLMGMSKCMYHLGDYELAIEIGESAIEMNRYFPQIHKYVALSHKANGNLSAALRTMGRAVNYETPWDEANRKLVLEMYQEVQEEAKEVNACSEA